MRTGAVIQARLSSTRLPGKVLLDLPYGSGISVLEQVVRRLKGSSRLDEIIVATTKDAEDERIVETAEKEGVGRFRGSRDDVLSRYHLAASENGLDVIVRVTSDCPCIDPSVVDYLIEDYTRDTVDYVSNTLTRTYPRGLDVEVFSFKALEETQRKAEKDSEREHVTPFMYKSGRFRIRNVEAPAELQRPGIRVTLDTREDYALLCAVYDFLYEENPLFGAKEIVELFDNRPWLSLINEGVAQKKTFDTLKEELEEAMRVLDLQDLRRARDFIAKRLP